MMEDLISGNEIVVNFDEQIVFNQLGHNKNAVWSLLMASGYLKPDTVEYRGELLEPWYYLSITNLETRSMFYNMFKGWFDNSDCNYNGFVLGLLVELRDIYEVKSNRESGFGRYDVMLIPKNDDKKYNAIILEFKVFDSYDESTLGDMVKSALKQIEEKDYDAELIAKGIAKDRIRNYGFAFEGKKVPIGE